MSNKNKEIVMPTWRDKQTPVNAANLNSMVQNIKQNSNDIEILSQAMSLLNDSKLDKVELQDNILKFYAKEVVKFSIAIPTGSGESGIPGQDGREIELRKGETHIEWSYVGEDNWKQLVSIEELKGQKGQDGQKGDAGTPGRDGQDGANGKEIELRKGENHIEWRYVEEESWKQLIALEDLKGQDGIPGINGQDGESPTLEIGNVSTLEPGSRATANVRLISENRYAIDLGIPRGAKGQDGTGGGSGSVVNPTLEIGSVTSGEVASAEIVGDSPNYTINLVLPKGEKGEQGPQGKPGAKGEQGPQGERGLTGERGEQGEKGNDGVTPNITIGEVTTLEAGQQATVTKTGTKEEPVFNFGIPKGQDGVGGDGSKDNSITGEKIKDNAIEFRHCNFLSGSINYENLHKKLTEGVSSGGGSIFIDDDKNSLSSVIKVIKNKSYRVKVTGPHDRFRICGGNFPTGLPQPTTTIPYDKSYTTDDSLDEFIIEDVGEVDTIIITVSINGQKPQVEVYLNEESDVEFRFPVKADFLKDSAIVNGENIIKDSLPGDRLKDITINPLKTTFILEGKNKYKGEVIENCALIAAGNGVLDPNDSEGCIIAYAQIKPSTTYTVSYPHDSEKFRICELNKLYDFTKDSIPNTADKLVVSNDMLKEHTFETSSEAKMILVYMSSKNKRYPLQIEEGGVKTDYRKYGYKLFDRYIEDITDIDMVTKMFKEFIIDKDNAYNKFYDCTELEYMENISDLKTQDVYDMYDKLMSENTAYITKEVLGQTTHGNIDVNCYKFIPPTMNITNFNPDSGQFETTGKPKEIKNRKKIFIISAVHGDERSSVIALYTFLKDICENNTNNVLLDKIKRELEFTVIPIANPTGYDNNSRYAKNSDGNLVMDLNRQCNETLIDGDTYPGLNNEAKIIADFIKKNKENLTLVLDLHNMQPQRGKNITWWCMNGDDLSNRGNRALIKCSKKWQEKYKFLEQEKGFLFGETTTADMSYPGKEVDTTIEWFAYKLGLNSMTLEFTTALNYPVEDSLVEKYNISYSKEQLNLHLSLVGNIISEYTD